MFKQLILSAVLTVGNSLQAMEQIKETPYAKEVIQEKASVKILLTDSHDINTIHEVAIPLRLAKRIGVISNLLENPELLEAGFPLTKVTLEQWLFIEPQLERLYGIFDDNYNQNSGNFLSLALLASIELTEEYGKLHANGCFELICALDYLDIQPLLELAFECYLQKSVNLDQYSALPGDMGNRALLKWILKLCGPMPARQIAVCTGHEDSVLEVCVTNDGEIVSGSKDKTVRVWDMKGHELAVCRGHEDSVGAVCLTNDGMIVSGSKDKTVRVWDMKGLELAVCRGHEDSVISVCVTNDGMIVSGSRDKTVRVWDIKGKLLAVCSGHKEAVRSVYVTNGGNIFSSSYDGIVRMWDVRGKELAVSRVHAPDGGRVCVTGEGKIVSGSFFDNTVYVSNVQGNALARCYGHEHRVPSEIGICSLYVSSDGKIVSSSRNLTMRVWDMKGNQLAVCICREGVIHSICLTSDGKIVSLSNDKTIRVWDISLLDHIYPMTADKAKTWIELLEGIYKQRKIGKKETWKEIEKFFAENAQVKIRLTDSQNSKATHEVVLPVRLAKLVGALSDILDNPKLRKAGFPLPMVTLDQWSLIERQLERAHGIIGHDEPNVDILRKRIIDEFEQVDATCLMELIKCLDYLNIPLLMGAACEVLSQVEFERFTFEQVSLLPGGIRNRIILQKLLSSCGPMRARKLAECRGHEGEVYSVCLTNDGKIVSGSEDNTVRVWDMNGKELALFKGHEEAVFSVCATREGKIVSGSEDNTVRIWDMDGNQLALCRGHKSGVYAVCITSDGKIVSGSADNTVRVWDMNGNKLALFKGHEDAVFSVCATNDGRIVSGSEDNTVRVWDMDGNQLALCRGHKSDVYSVCVTSDGKIVSCSRDDTVRVWDMNGNQLALLRDCKGVRSVCAVNDGKFAFGTWDDTMQVFDTRSNELALWRGRAHGSGHSICATSDGKIVSVQSMDHNAVRVFDISLMERLNRMDIDRAKAVWEFLERVSHMDKPTENDKKELWEEIEKIIVDNTFVRRMHRPITTLWQRYFH